MKKEIEVLETWSNLAYNIVGLLCFILQGDLLYCFALQALGVGSFIFHREKKKPMFLFDWWAMSFVVSILFGITVNHYWGWIGVVIYQFLYSYFLMGRLSVYVEVAISSIPALLAIIVTKELSSSIIIITMFLVAILIRSKDIDPKQVIFHDSKYHAIWHILTAAGFYFANYLN